MKRIVILLVTVLSACEPERFVPTYPSLAGDWYYEFPGGATEVWFTLAKTSAAYEISASKVIHNGIELTGHEAKFLDIDDLTYIEQIVFDANAEPDGYVVKLTGLTTDSKNSKMHSVGTMHRFHNETIQSFEDQVINRKTN